MQKKSNDLGNDSVGRLVVRLAVPAIVAQLVNALYNIVDRIYIGHIADVGDIALTGLGLCFPIIMFVSALAALVGIGGGSRASILMGDGDLHGANEILGNCAVLMLMISVGSTALFQLTKEPLLYLFGASGNTIPYALSYLEIYLWGSIFVQIALGMNNFITIQGFSTISMATVLVGAAVNIALDPIFIFGLNMGVRGAALATVIAQSVSAAWVIAFLVGKRTKMRLQLAFFRLKRSVILPVVALGVSPFIMQSTESLVTISFTSSLYRYGGDVAVGAMTICSSIMQFLCMVFMGLAQGAQPIIGFNYGAGKADRVKQAFRILILSSLVYAGCMWGLIMALPQVFVGLFNSKAELVEITVWALRIYLACFFLLGIQFSCQQTFVALGQAKVSLFLALLRKVILLIPLIFILPQFVGDKVFAVFLAEPVADFLAAAVTGTVFFVQLPKILKAKAGQSA